MPTFWWLLGFDQYSRQITKIAPAMSRAGVTIAWTCESHGLDAVDGGAGDADAEASIAFTI